MNKQPGTFHTPPSPPPDNDQNMPYSNNTLLFFIFTAIVSISLALAGNTAPIGSFLYFVSHAGVSVFLGLLVIVAISDWKGFISLHNLIKWKNMEQSNQVGMGCLLVCFFPLMLCIYLVRTTMTAFWYKSSTNIVPSYQGQNGSAPRSQNKRIVVGLIAGVAVACMSFSSTIGADANGTMTLANTVTPAAPVHTQQALASKPTHTPSPTPSPTPKPPMPTPTLPPPPTPTPQSASATGVNGNPWGYDFNPGNYIKDPPPGFCDYFPCIKNFPNGNGYVVECNDGMYSKSGGISGSCSRHGGDMRPLYSH